MLNLILVILIMEQVILKKDLKIPKKLNNAQQLNQILVLVIHALKIQLKNAEHNFVLIMILVRQIVLVMLLIVYIILISALINRLVQVIQLWVLMTRPNKHGAKEFRIVMETFVLGTQQILHVKIEHVPM